MILFDLLCSQDHRFEAWFRDGDSFDRLAAVGEVQCTLCGDTKVRKALMAPNISTSKTKDMRAAAERIEDASASSGEPASSGKPTSSDGDGGSAASAPPSDAPGGPPAAMAIQENRTPLGGPDHLPVPEKVAEAMHVLRQVQTHIEKTFDHVGERFAEEARKMHYGEAEKRSIYGKATENEAEELAEEGIEVNRMPWLTPRND